MLAPRTLSRSLATFNRAFNPFPSTDKIFRDVICLSCDTFDEISGVSFH